MSGFATFKMPLTPDLEAEVNIYRQDHGGWHSLIQRFFKDYCTQYYIKSGLAYPAKMLLVPSIPDGCPMQPGTYNLSQNVMPRYRKEWPSELQAHIPVMVPSADKWKVEVKISRNGKFLSKLVMEFRLINSFMSQ